MPLEHRKSRLRRLFYFFEKILQTQYVYMRYFCPSSILIPKSSMTSRSSAAILSFMSALARYIPALTTTDMSVTRSIRYFRIYWNDKNRLTAPDSIKYVTDTTLLGNQYTFLYQVFYIPCCRVW